MSRTHTCAQNRVWMHTHIHTRDGHTPAHSIVCKNKVLRLRFDEEVCATLLLTPGYVQPSHSPPGMCNPPLTPGYVQPSHSPPGVYKPRHSHHHNHRQSLMPRVSIPPPLRPRSVRTAASASGPKPRVSSLSPSPRSKQNTQMVLALATNHAHGD